MDLQIEGLPVFLNPFLGIETVIKTDDNEVVMHPYTAGMMMLETTAYTYLSVFQKIGVTDHAIKACLDSALKRLEL